MPETFSSFTSTALLEGLFDAQNGSVWRTFDDRYRPIVTGFAVRLGLSSQDAEDVAQDTLAQFVVAYRAGKYERGRGRLRSWLIGMAKTRVGQLKRSRARLREQSGASRLADVPDEAGLDRVWEEEQKMSMLRQALIELRSQTRTSEKVLEAFEQYVLKRRAAEDVARELGMTPRDVYVAKTRVADRLRKIVARLEGLFDDG